MRAKCFDMLVEFVENDIYWYATRTEIARTIFLGHAHVGCHKTKSASGMHAVCMYDAICMEPGGHEGMCAHNSEDLREMHHVLFYPNTHVSAIPLFARVRAR